MRTARAQQAPGDNTRKNSTQESPACRAQDPPTEMHGWDARVTGVHTDYGVSAGVWVRKALGEGAVCGRSQPTITRGARGEQHTYYSLGRSVRGSTYYSSKCY